MRLALLHVARCDEHVWNRQPGGAQTERRDGATPRRDDGALRLAQLPQQRTRAGRGPQPPGLDLLHGVQHRRLGGGIELGSDEAQRLGDAAPMRHPQEVRGIEPALVGPRVPDEVDTLSRIDEYAIQIEQDGATRHGRNGMNLLGSNEPAFRRPFAGLSRASYGPFYGPFTGLKRACTPPTPRATHPRSRRQSPAPARR